MRLSFRTGVGFGVTSGIITTLGLMVGLHSGTHAKSTVIGGILAIAVADAFSDALAIHVAEESRKLHSQKEIWEATFSTFASKFVFAITFVVPLFLFELGTAIIAAVIWGLTLLALFNYIMARKLQVSPWKMVLEHLGIAIAVIAITHYVGEWISKTFM